MKPGVIIFGELRGVLLVHGNVPPKLFCEKPYSNPNLSSFRRNVRTCERTCYWKLMKHLNLWKHENLLNLWTREKWSRSTLVTGSRSLCLRIYETRELLSKLWEWLGIMPIFMKIWELCEKPIVIEKLMKKLRKILKKQIEKRLQSVWSSLLRVGNETCVEKFISIFIERPIWRLRLELSKDRASRGFPLKLWKLPVM